MIPPTTVPPPNSTLPAAFQNAFDIDNGNYTSNYTNYTAETEIPYYIRATSMTFCIVIMCLGVIGNVMVPIVILKTKDMRNSTNIFLVNLSVADLMVLLVCTPTVLVEVNSRPETWLLGKELCLAVPFVELTVAHASVLTILAISFERYYAICEPLRAGYVCTKTRATLICFLAWFFAAVFTSPVLSITEHRLETTSRGAVGQCITDAASFWKSAFYVMITSLLFLLPLVILIVLYTVIAKNLISAASKVVMNKHDDPFNVRARKQVILMLGTVVLSFFVCLAPYRILIIWILLSPSEATEEMSLESYLNILYFCRVMIYLNSAINPILYNLMSSKFRSGFCKICRVKRKTKIAQDVARRRRATFNTGSTSSSTLSRTTNSLKQIFSKRSSLDRSVRTDTELETVELDTKKPHNKVTHESTPLNDKVDDPEGKKVGLTKTANSNGWIYKLLPLKHKQISSNVNRQDGCDVSTFDLVNKLEPVDSVNKVDPDRKREYRQSKSLEIQGSLRRSVLLNSAKAKSVDCDTKVETITIDKLSVKFCKDRGEKSYPESYV